MSTSQSLLHALHQPYEKTIDQSSTHKQ